MDSVIVEGIDRIRKDRAHGAAWLSRQAIGVMKLAAVKSEAEGVARFLEEQSDVAGRLVEARPSMASITNLVSRFVYEVSNKARDERDLDLLRGFASLKGDELIRDSVAAALEASENGAGIIENGDRLMTCSYSSTICQAFRMAKNGGKEIEVIALESQSHGGATAQELRSHDISVEVVHDDAVKNHISRARMVLVGADSILGDGSLINGTPTYALAAAAKEAEIPFYPVCETIKFNVGSYLGQRVELEKGFDLVPARLIAGIITEKGIIKPGEVIDHMQGMRSYIFLPGHD
jgi:translation initiation factor eIF-2B subunit delta